MFTTRLVIFYCVQIRIEFAHLFLCRYVMDTYSNPHNQRTNHGLAAFHSFASWGVVLPATTGKCCDTSIRQQC